jgi:hypothetical protein
VWAALGRYLNDVTAAAASPVVEKYSGLLGAADVTELTHATTFAIPQSLRLNSGVGIAVHR